MDSSAEFAWHVQDPGFDPNSAGKQVSKTCFLAGDGALVERKERRREGGKKGREREEEGRRRMEGRKEEGGRGKGKRRGTENPFTLAT